MRVSKEAMAKAEELMPVVDISIRRDRVAAYIQQVSDACKRNGFPELAPFVLPEPVDPLRAAIDEAYDGGGRVIGHCGRDEFARLVRKALLERGLAIVPVSK